MITNIIMQFIRTDKPTNIKRSCTSNDQAQTYIFCQIIKKSDNSL